MNYFGQWSNLELLRQDGSRRLASDVLSGAEYVVLFFGASWCRESDSFMDIIGGFYEAHHETKKFEVVYLSRDYSREEMMRGFLLSERATAAAERSGDQQCIQGLSHRRLNPEGGQERYQGRIAEGDPPGSAGRPRGSVQDSTHNSDHRKISSRASTSFSTTPPPLKRVAELSGTTMTTGGLARTLVKPLISRGPRGFWAVPYDYIGCVGVPILYHLRVFTYPGVVVCRNKRLSVDVKPTLLPTLDVEKQLPAVQCTSTLSGKQLSEGSAAGSTQPSLLPSLVLASVPQRRQKTPMLARREFYPDVVTIAGRFMLEQDPSGEHFPWDQMSSKTRRSALIFFVIVGVLTVMVLSWGLPLILVARQVTSMEAPTKF